MHQTSAAYFSAGLLIQRLLLKAISQSAGVNLLYVNEKCKCHCIRFLNMQASSLMLGLQASCVLRLPVLSCTVT